MHRILIIKWSALGDVAVATAVMDDIRRAYPAARIDINVLPPWDRLFRGDPRFHEVISFALRGRGPGATLRWLRTVRANRYDMIVDLQCNDRSRLLLALLRLSGARVPVIAGNRPGVPYTVSPPALPPRLHAAERQRAELAAAGIPAAADVPSVHVPERNRERARALLQAHGLADRRFAVFLPGCQPAGYLKRWGALRYGALALYLREAGLDRAALLGSADEGEECAAIAAVAGDAVVNLCGMTEVLDLIPICEPAAAIVANDTGTAHLTAAARVPMVVIFGPTDPVRARPLGGHVTTLQAPIFCINCYRKTCTHQSCMELISPEAVMEHLASVISGDSRRPDSDPAADRNVT